MDMAWIFDVEDTNGAKLATCYPRLEKVTNLLHEKNHNTSSLAKTYEQCC